MLSDLEDGEARGLRVECFRPLFRVRVSGWGFDVFFFWEQGHPISVYLVGRSICVIYITK